MALSSIQPEHLPISGEFEDGDRQAACGHTELKQKATDRQPTTSIYHQKQHQAVSPSTEARPSSLTLPAGRPQRTAPYRTGTSPDKLAMTRLRGIYAARHAHNRSLQAATRRPRWSSSSEVEARGGGFAELGCPPSCAPDGGPIDRDRGSLPCALGEQEGAAPCLALPRAMGYLLPGFESGRTTEQRSLLPLPTDW